MSRQSLVVLLELENPEGLSAFHLEEILAFVLGITDSIDTVRSDVSAITLDRCSVLAVVDQASAD